MIKYLLLVALLSACTMKGSVDLDSSPALLNCTDSRNGEMFSYRPIDVYDVRIGLLGGETCLSLTDTTNRDRTFCSPEFSTVRCTGATK